MTAIGKGELYIRRDVGLVTVTEDVPDLDEADIVDVRDGDGSDQIDSFFFGQEYVKLTAAMVEALRPLGFVLPDVEGT